MNLGPTGTLRLIISIPLSFCVERYTYIYICAYSFAMTSYSICHLLSTVVITYDLSTIERSLYIFYVESHQYVHCDFCCRFIYIISSLKSMNFSLIKFK
jgi:hypothetical protein